MNMSFPAVQPHSPPLNSVVSLTHRPSPVSSHQSAPAHHPHPIPFIFSPGCEPQVAGDISLRHAKAVLEEVDSAPFLDVSHPGFVHGLLEVALIGFSWRNRDRPKSVLMDRKWHKNLKAEGNHHHRQGRFQTQGSRELVKLFLITQFSQWISYNPYG